MIKRATDKLFKLNEEDLEKINSQRRTWLYASSIVVISVVFLIFGWNWLDHFHSKELWWFIVSLMLIISVNWWYWTMRMVSKMIGHQRIEMAIVQELVNDIREIKQEVKKLGNQDLDKSK
jgi:biotin transporter BioY